MSIQEITGTVYRCKGQGMVEYAGALLVAAAIVVSLLASAPGVWSNLYTFVANNVFTQLGI